MQKTAIVTGASRGFGRGIASVLSIEGGYKVFATARNKAALDRLKKEVDEFKGAGEVIPYVLDQNNDKEVEKFSEEIFKVPEFIATEPVFVLFPDNTSVPVPSLSKFPDPAIIPP